MPFAARTIKHVIAFALIGALLAAGPVFAQTNPDILRQRIQELEEKRKQIEEEQQKIQQSIGGTQERAKTLQEQINNLNSQIRYMENQIALTSTQISKTEAEIEVIETSISDAESKIDYQKRAIAQTILFLARQSDESLLVSMFKNDNISDFLRQTQYISSINANLVDLVRELRDTKANLEGQKTTLNGKKSDLETYRQQQNSERSALNSTKSQTNSLLNSTKGQEAEYKKQLASAEELERQINVEIFNLQEELRRALDPSSIPGARPGLFLWPVRGTITQKYGCIHTSWARRTYSPCDNGAGGFHDGLDIAAPFGTNILAPADGEVVGIGSAPRAYGTWVAIRHDSGIVTFYAHMSVRIANTMGQRVKAGEPIGKIGLTGITTGPHLHFIVYVPNTFSTVPSKISGTLPIGVPLNPMDYL